MMTKRFPMNEIPADARYVCYRQDENNYYDDSDFYFMIHDRVENKIIKHVYGTTRFGGHVDFPHELHMLIDGFGSHHEYENQVVKELALKMAPEFASARDIQIGDIVKVTNPRVRKFKGETFKVQEMRDFKLRYGMVATTTLFGENVFSEPIKTNKDNVEVITHNDKKLDSVAFRLMVGLSLT